MQNFVFVALAYMAFMVSASRINGIPSAMTKHGPVFTENTTTEGITVYKGIPYATPPTKELRWRSPVPPKDWTEPLNATSFSNGCYGFAGIPTTWTESEDCLYLNIWTPATSPRERLPVMLWVHGGGFEFDSAMNPIYDGVNLAKRGVILVTMEYRMGNFGFLARKDLDNEDPNGNSGNYGIQDLIMSLRWVKENIQNFGGDPKNVLIFGESAGAHAMGIVMASPSAQGLFDKVIMQSGAWWDDEHGNMENFEQSRARGETWGNAMIPNATPSGLRQLSVDAIVQSSHWNTSLDPSTTAFSPNIDQYIIPKLIPSVFEAGAQSKVPLLAGVMRREDFAFESRALRSTNASVFNARLFDYFNESGKSQDHIQKGIQQFYPAKTDEEAKESSMEMIGDMVISHQTWEAVHLHSQTTSQSTFFYLFNFTSAYTPIPAHGSDLPYTFGNFISQEPANSGPAGQFDEMVSQNMITYWTNFAKSGNPNLPDTRNGTLAAWPHYVACKTEARRDEKSCGAKQHQIFEFGNSIGASEFDYSRYEFLSTFRDNGALPAGWHDFILP